VHSFHLNLFVAEEDLNTLPWACTLLVALKPEHGREVLLGFVGFAMELTDVLFDLLFF